VSTEKPSQAQRVAVKKRTLETTKTPGVYRRGASYVVMSRVAGKQVKRYARTYGEARTLKKALDTDDHRGVARETTNLTFEEYARVWIESYTGRREGGFRESTRAGYRFSMEHRAIPFFNEHSKSLAEIDAPMIRLFVAWLFEQKVSGRAPAVSTVRGHVAAVKVLLATAVGDGKITHNPAMGVPIRQVGAEAVKADPADIRRAMDSEQLSAFLHSCPNEWELFFKLLYMTGIRIGEAVELRWKDVDLGQKKLLIRRRIYQGKVASPKSKSGTRDIPISTGLARELWGLQGGPEELLFASVRGHQLDRDWLWKNVLKPTAKQAGVPWVGFHTFRHTCASMLFKQGKNAKEVSVWLGHSDPSFTLRTYIHLIDEGLGSADFLDDTHEQLVGVTPRVTRATRTGAIGGPPKPETWLDRADLPSTGEPRQTGTRTHNR
jgi:integrase